MPKDWKRVHPRDSSVTWIRYGALEEDERRMALQLPEDTRFMRMDKRALKQAVDALNAEMGFEPDPDATPEKAQQMLLDAGIRPEDNVGSCEILRMRSNTSRGERAWGGVV